MVHVVRPVAQVVRGDFDQALLLRLAEGNTLGLAPGTVVGKVVDVIEVAQWLLKIRLANPVKDADGVVVENSALVPFVDELVPDIDLEGGYLTLDPPGGLIPGL